MERRTDRDPRALTRRRLLGGVAVAVAGGSVGCLGGPTDEPGGPSTIGTRRTETTNTDGTAREGTPATERPSDGGASADQPRIASVSVSDFIEYALAGVHPHVHSRANVQYVVVGVDPSSTTAEPGTIRERLGLVLDGQPMELAVKQPYAWRRQTVDVAFAVPKDETFDSGVVQFDGQDVRSLSTARLGRLNNPPAFAVSELTITPAEIGAGERATATVRFTVANTGDGAGTFGASVQGNYTSGAATVTATLDPDGMQELTQDVEILERGEAVTVTVDWGIRERRLTVPVAGGTATARAGAETNTETPTPN